MYIQAPRCIRIFKTWEEAKWGKDVLSEAGIPAKITEDHFYKLTLADLGMESRFRLIIDNNNIEKAAEYLVKKLRQVVKE